MKGMRIDGLVYPPPSDFMGAIRQNGILLHKIRFLTETLKQLNQEHSMRVQPLLQALGVLAMDSGDKIVIDKDVWDNFPDETQVGIEEDKDAGAIVVMVMRKPKTNNNETPPSPSS